MSAEPLGGILDAREILQTALARYESFVSYRDAGVIRLFLFGYERPPVVETFITSFQRPQLLRFELINDLGKHRVVFDETGGTYEREGQPIEKFESLIEAVGVYALECSSIVALLCPDERSFWPLGLKDLKVDGVQVVDRTECWRITGQHPLGRDEQLFFGRSDFLLRRYITISEGVRWEQQRMQIQVEPHGELSA